MHSPTKKQKAISDFVSHNASLSDALANKETESNFRLCIPQCFPFRCTRQQRTRKQFQTLYPTMLPFPMHSPTKNQKAISDFVSHNASLSDALANKEPESNFS